MAKGKKGNTAPILDDVTIEIAESGLFSYTVEAFDPDPKDKLKYAFLVDGKETLSVTIDNSNVFSIDAKTGLITSSNPLLTDQVFDFTLTVQVTDKFHLADIGAIRLLLPPLCTPFSLDIGDPTTNPPVAVDASDAAYCFTTDANANTHVVISGFGTNDIIEVSGVSSLADLSFATGPDDFRDLWIVYGGPSGTTEIITLDNVLSGFGFVFDYATAAAAIGFDFMTIA